MKRFLSLTIVLMMVLSLVQLPAFAADAVAGTDYNEISDNEISILTSLGWSKLFSTWNVAGKTIYLDGDIEINGTGASLNCTLIGKQGGVNVTLTSLPMFSALAANSTVSNLILQPKEGSTYTFSSSYQGVLVKEVKATNVKISEIINYISCTNTGGYSMSIIGAVNSGTTIEISDCVNYGDFSATATTSFAGGILGAARNGSDNVTIKNCVNNGDISAVTGSGGIYGGSYNNDATVTIENCTNNIDSTIGGNDKNNVGGIIGSLRGNYTVKNCVNKGNVIGAEYVGGIVGGYQTVINAADQEIISCTNLGSVSSTDYAGGIVGYNVNYITISKCANIGNVTTTKAQAGGIAGQLGSSTVSECFNTGAITAGTNYAGGIAGNKNAAGLTYSITIENSYNAGTITAANGYAAGIIFSMSNRKNNSTDTDQTMVSVYNSGDINGEGNCYHICPIMHTGTNGVATVNNLYYTSHNNHDVSSVIYHTSYSEGENKDEYIYVSMPSTALKAPTENGFDTLPDGFDENIWVACENGYPILRNNLPKNADGTDKEYWEVTLVNGENGEALKSEKTYVEKGTTYTLALEPSKGYEVESVTAGETVCAGTDDIYEITVSDDVTVTVAYSKIPVTESTVSASELFVPVDADRYEIYAFATYGVVEDNAATDFGMLLSFEKTDDFTLDNSSLRKFSAYNGKGANEYGEYGVMLYGALITEDGTYYCVPYVTYTDGTTCYGNVMTIGE